MTPISPVFHSTPIPSISYYSHFFFFYLPSHFFPRRLEERARDGTARYDSRDERDGDGTGYHFFLEKKKKTAFVCFIETDSFFFYIAQGSFSFPTFSFSSNCISLRLFVLDERYLFLGYISSFISPPPPLLFPSEYSSSLFHFTYNPLYIFTCPHNHFFHTYLPNL